MAGPPLMPEQVASDISRCPTTPSFRLACMPHQLLPFLAQARLGSGSATFISPPPACHLIFFYDAKRRPFLKFSSFLPGSSFTFSRRQTEPA